MAQENRTLPRERQGGVVGRAIEGATLALIIAGCTDGPMRPNPAGYGFGGTPPAYPGPVLPAAPFNTESYDRLQDNRFVAVLPHPVSTFAIDVDTASYSNVRRFLREQQLPPADAVRIEELINYFPYPYAAPAKDDPHPLAATCEVAAAPWAPEHRLVRIGLQGRAVPRAQRPPANLVFLIDVSGSMQAPNKLPLVQRALRLLLAGLDDEDEVAIVVYAGATGLALPSTRVREKAAIRAAVDALVAQGSTNGGAGIQLAYDIAVAHFRPGGINRVILATDGDFNVGLTNRGDLVRLIREQARRGVQLTALGFGYGNLQDDLLEQLADSGDGVYAYIDSAAEARQVLGRHLTGSLLTIAHDVKVQVEFNPARVQAYRQIGYENRRLAREDFNDDAVDAGDLGAGHAVTALYEIVPVGAPPPSRGGVDPLRYQVSATADAVSVPEELRDEFLTVKIRYRMPDEGKGASRLLSFALRDRGTSFAASSPDFKFVAAAVGFGMLLRDSPYKGTTGWDDVVAWATAGQDAGPGGGRAELVELARRARRLARE